MVSGMDDPRDQLTRVALLVALAGMLLGACGPADAASGTSGALARFRTGLAEPTGLSGGAPTLDELVARFVRALERRDTAALVQMHVTRAEFAWLYYPTNPQARAPYNLSPDLMWFMEQGNSEKGVQHLLADRAGLPLGVVAYRCDPVTSRQGQNTVIGPCVVRRTMSGRDTIEERLFGLIVERGGQFKFVSYANKL
jgi:hypothetical protein